MFEVLARDDEWVRFKILAGKDTGSLEDRAIMCLRHAEFEELNQNVFSQEIIADLYSDVDIVVIEEQQKNLMKARISATVLFHRIKRNLIKDSNKDYGQPISTQLLNSGPLRRSIKRGNG